MTGRDEFDRVMEVLRHEYLIEAAERMAELRAGLADLRSGAPDMRARFKTLFHRLAGSGGSYGFPGISAIAKEAEQWVVAQPELGAGEVVAVESRVDRLAEELARARAQLEG
ncbi:MAG TPA: Hpt domain-containing protein [Gemmatimonadales bacterium]|nr:Hpt domain-containing protein [Gemmatimonadales bacterium]